MWHVYADIGEVQDVEPASGQVTWAASLHTFRSAGYRLARLPRWIAVSQTEPLHAAEPDIAYGE